MILESLFLTGIPGYRFFSCNSCRFRRNVKIAFLQSFFSGVFRSCLGVPHLWVVCQSIRILTSDDGWRSASIFLPTNKKSIKFPWFILLFVLAILFANFFPGLQTSYEHFSWLGKRGMVIALFLIGSNISISQIKQSGANSFALGITLWAVIAIGSLFFLTL